MSSTSPIPSSLPIELIEEILDYVNCLPDKDIQGILRHPSRGYNSGRVTTLASCSLVCRAWLPRSRFHLFVSSSPITTKTRLYILKTKTRRGIIIGYTKFYPTSISPYSQTSNLDYMSEDDFMKTLERLSSPTTITHLSIAYYVFWTQDHFIQALSSIKSRIPQCDDKTQYPLPALPASVSSLIINIGIDADVGWMAKIVSVTGASLKRLNIKVRPMVVTWDGTMEEFYSGLDFDCHPNLEVIAFDSLSLGTRQDELDGRMKNRHIPVILRKISTSSIREVVLSLAPAPGDSMIKDPDDLDSLDLESIGEILRQQNYSKLELLSLLGIDCLLRPQVKKILSERMTHEHNRPVYLYMSSERGMFMQELFGW
ncbi:hypothetical protein IW261DRAFT_1533181 [Armillaria novae-zelandiae]|uniref:Uncharacterized protein n=1 Tax=Armillaria novae-zelandiae TaxID=153914 RepID=A0AA39N848_9AGAR|nr:hypothetical protein IW261DRAFT_1533181 [Armillaria novae-zelandiae]